ncbi:head-tail connector protein [Roseobacter sp. YSTF-M11]|uniref:Head-tail connector protein n=1 Tax=Roseobacter insulae TaxID=2859783 RepID=A0A9X1FVI5_9RHOB|nr:head-tail connector protein [Roseobacter insulae]MBW4708534.1 head-tail connector protein [Roseobacter insulae]
MMLIEETTVPDAALPVEEFKAHLRLGTSFGNESAQDEVLSGFLRAAMAAVEARTGKVLMTRPFSWSLTFWRDRDAQVLPVAPVSVVNHVWTVARDGSQAEIDAAQYWLERDSQRPRLRSVGACLPVIPQGGSALVEFEAGYGLTWSDLPADLRQAVLLLASHYYEYRHETSLSDGCMPFGVSSLIERYKVLRMGPGANR